MAVNCELAAVTIAEAKRVQLSHSCPSPATLTCTAAWRVSSTLTLASRKLSERSTVLPEVPCARKQATFVGVAELLVSTTLELTMYEPSGTKRLVTEVLVTVTGVVDRPNWAVNPAEGP